jgi:hypothetical protein
MTKAKDPSPDDTTPNDGRDDSSDLERARQAIRDAADRVAAKTKPQDTPPAS